MSKPLPPWLRPVAPKRPYLASLGRRLAGAGVNTVCQSARCPNLGECFARGNAAFMIMGDICTRNCRFCAVEHGAPAPLDPDEPRRVAEAAAELGLRHVVVTSVTRDDLPGGGAAHFAATIAAMRELLPGSRVEVLVPDFQGDTEALRTVLQAGPDVLNHNIETVPRCYPEARPQAHYARSLDLLRASARISHDIVTKSGFMVGLGETEEEIYGVLRDLRAAAVAAVTIGQYLQPTRRHLPVAAYIHPDVFHRYAEIARALGFPHVLSGPLVRSSYHARDLIQPHSDGERIERPDA
jgi:lipoic acid synthetase